MQVYYDVYFCMFCFIWRKWKTFKGRVQKKKVGIFPKGGGGPSDLGFVSHFYLIIFKHGLNHLEMQRNFVHSLVTPPPLI